MPLDKITQEKVEQVNEDIKNIVEIAEDLNQEKADKLCNELDIFLKKNNSILLDFSLRNERKELAKIVDKLVIFLIETPADHSDYENNHCKAQELIGIVQDFLPIEVNIGTAYGAFFDAYFRASLDTKFKVLGVVEKRIERLLTSDDMANYIHIYQLFIETKIRLLLKSALTSTIFGQQIANLDQAIKLTKQVGNVDTSQALYESCYSAIVKVARLAKKTATPDLKQIIILLTQIHSSSVNYYSGILLLFPLLQQRIATLIKDPNRFAKCTTPKELAKSLAKFLKKNKTNELKDTPQSDEEKSNLEILANIQAKLEEISTSWSSAQELAKGDLPEEARRVFVRGTVGQSESSNLAEKLEQFDRLLKSRDADKLENHIFLMEYQKYMIFLENHLFDENSQINKTVYDRAKKELSDLKPMQKTFCGYQDLEFKVLRTKMCVDDQVLTEETFKARYTQINELSRNHHHGELLILYFNQHISWLLQQATSANPENVDQKVAYIRQALSDAMLAKENKLASSNDLFKQCHKEILILACTIEGDRKHYDTVLDLLSYVNNGDSWYREAEVAKFHYLKLKAKILTTKSNSTNIDFNTDDPKVFSGQLGFYIAKNFLFFDVSTLYKNLKEVCVEVGKLSADVKNHSFEGLRTSLQIFESRVNTITPQK